MVGQPGFPLAAFVSTADSCTPAMYEAVAESTKTFIGFLASPNNLLQTFWTDGTRPVKGGVSGAQ